MKPKSIEEIRVKGWDILLKSNGAGYREKGRSLYNVLHKKIKEDRQHLIQTIRKEVEGMRMVYKPGSYQGRYDKFGNLEVYFEGEVTGYNQALEDILTYLTTLEEEVSK
jgi:hypothetical protein